MVTFVDIFLEGFAMWVKHYGSSRRYRRARQLFWIITLATGILFAAWQYMQSPEQHEVWDKAFSCQSGAGPLGGEAGIVLLGIAHLAMWVGAMIAGEFFAHRLGALGTVIAVGALYVTSTFLGAPQNLIFAAAIGIVFGWAARGKMRHFPR